ncbi:EAL domain-containing protein [Shewanella sp. Scap07]|uniref:GGDEF domain-containing phosphodiesterase n=1 Tax=Shewanella sp. Scap07 TaxID=2589987 RepID=UPI0015BD2729|nr:GGDEF domain-containing phosphodiesterase [Shewanella sp. Scap07]QLE84450.1 EAL domain-containing protein [Shewanella sp. Scap07]
MRIIRPTQPPITEFNGILELFPYPAAILDLYGVIVMTNQKWQQFACLKGLQVSQWVGANYLNLLKQQDKNAAILPQDAHLQLDQVIEQKVDMTKYSYTCKNNGCGHFYEMVTKRFQCECHDYLIVSHQQKENRDELINSQQRLAIAADAAQIGIWDYDLKHDLLIWDEWLYRIYGIDSSTTQAVYETWENGVHPEDLPQAIQDFQRAITTGENFNSQFRIIRGDGEIRHIEASAKVIKDNQGKSTRIIGSNIDITDRVASNHTIEQLSHYDPLTKLPNRQSLEQKLLRGFTSLDKPGFFAALLLIDIDHFKEVNDIHGHPVGDQVLISVAKRLKANIGSEDYICRFSADEFVIFVPHISDSINTTKQYSQVFADNIQHSFRQSLLTNQGRFKLTLSIGVTLFNEARSNTDELLQQADLALYQAKKNGRNSVSFFAETMLDCMLEKKQMMSDLEYACRHHQFELHYQGQFSQQHGLIGAETLLRWHHKSKGMISPDQFVPLLEESGLIVPTGKWILEQACLQLGDWAKDDKFKNLTLSVNVSAVQLLDDQFCRDVKRLLALYHAPADKLKLEITEGIFIENIQATIAIMAELAEIGVTFSLDDFGTGFSSLSYLKSLPLSQLKIDKSFVTDILHDDNDVAIAATIVTLAKSLGLNVIAEGVELEQQQAVLKKIGCECYQGFLYHKPCRIDEFKQLVNHSLPAEPHMQRA